MQSTLRQVPQRKTFCQWALQSEGLAKEFQERVGEELSTAHSAERGAREGSHSPSSLMLTNYK